MIVLYIHIGVAIVSLIISLICVRSDAKFYEELFNETHKTSLKIIDVAERVLKTNSTIIDENEDIKEFNERLISEQEELSKLNLKLIMQLENKEETNNDCERVSEGGVENCEQTTEC